MANVGLLIAGGSGARMPQDIPKQFLTVNEKPVIVYTLEAFQTIRKLMKLQLCVLRGGNRYFGLMLSSLIFQNYITLFQAERMDRILLEMVCLN